MVQLQDIVDCLSMQSMGKSIILIVRMKSLSMFVTV